MLYFTNPPAGYDITANAGKVAFFPSNPIQNLRGNWLLPVGGHAVVGSAGNVSSDAAANLYTTTFGRRLGITQLNEGSAATLALGNTRKIQLDPINNQVRVRDYQQSTTSMMTRTRTGVLALPIDLSRYFDTTTGVMITRPRSFNVSDPFEGYPTVDSTGNPAVDVGDDLAYTAAYNEPLDSRYFNPNRLSVYGTAHPHANLTEFNSLSFNRTSPTYRVVHLQRLANPLQDYDPMNNPYRTVDSMSVNLTSFNGVDRGDDENLDPNTTPPRPGASPFEKVIDLASMERGRNRKYPPRGQFDPVAGNLNEHRNLWSNDGIDELRKGFLIRTDLPVNINEVVRAGLPVTQRTLSIANPAAGTADEHYFDNSIFETLGAFNDSWFDGWADNNNRPTNPPPRGPLAPGYTIGMDATKPFNWLTWLNRPFVSQLELTNVPPYSSSQLTFRAYSLAANDPYPAANTNISGFGYLCNWFNDRKDTYSVGMGSNLHETEWSRLLDFLEVPSRYIGTETYFNPNNPDPMAGPVFYGLNPPYNGFSNFRYPGKINVNTVFDSRVWSGLMGELADPSLFSYNAMDRTRYFVDAADPTRLKSNPFRPAEAADSVVDGATVLGAVPPYATAPFTGVDSGLFRRLGSPTAVGVPPLFDLIPAMQLPFQNTDRNAYFRHQGRQRLGNLVTTRSSVFAVWITIGYFEVDATGAVTQNEVGEDYGDVRRHRAFFIYDRSVPVAFEPGVDHNVENGILVESFIE